MQRLLTLHYILVPSISALQFGACCFCITVKRLLLLHNHVAPAASALECSICYFCIAV
jgi:hypothetical protein